MSETPRVDALAGLIQRVHGSEFSGGCCHWRTVHEHSVPDPDDSVTLHDHFSATVELRIAEIQPQYGLVQLNATRRACGVPGVV